MLNGDILEYENFGELLDAVMRLRGGTRGSLVGGQGLRLRRGTPDLRLRRHGSRASEASRAIVEITEGRSHSNYRREQDGTRILTVRNPSGTTVGPYCEPVGGGGGASFVPMTDDGGGGFIIPPQTPWRRPPSDDDGSPPSKPPPSTRNSNIDNSNMGKAARARKPIPNEMMWSWYNYNFNPWGAWGANLPTYSAGNVTTGLFWTYNGATDPELIAYNFNSNNINIWPCIYNSGVTGTIGTIVNIPLDWIYGNMACSSDASSITTLVMAKVADNVNDPNSQLQLTTLLGNLDWNSITHYGSYWDLLFTNFSFNDYTVEILLYKAIPEVTTLALDKFNVLPLSDEKYMEAYCRNRDMQMGTKQIRVISRKRITLKGVNKMENFIQGTSGNANFGSVNTQGCTKLVKVRSKRTYVMRRPIPQNETDINTLTDQQFYNLFFDEQRAIYMRISAWPTIPLIVNVEASGSNPYSPQFVQSVIDTANSAVNFSTNAYQAQVRLQMWKKSYFTLDRQILKGPVTGANH